MSLGTVLSEIADLTGYGRRDIINPGKAVIYVSWKENFMKSFDMTYKLVNAKTRNLKYPCYGGRFSWFLVSRHFENLYFYLTQNSLVYTAGGTYITEIPFDSIKKLSIKRGLFAKSSIHIRIVADKRYHLLLKDMKWLSTRRTGNNEDNIRGFVETLQSNVMTNK